jgi:DNA-directed RNA polymerase subunit RPC12/RpoP
MPYECGNCGYIIKNLKELEESFYKCPKCGSRVFYKTRSQIVKRIKL